MTSLLVFSFLPMPPSRHRIPSPAPSAASSSSSSASSADHGPGLIAPTAFDAYILAHSKPSKTSTSSFSALVPSLPPDYKLPTRPTNAFSEPPLPYEALWNRWMLSLDADFDICLYGYGSKQDLLSGFANRLKRKGNVVLIKGYMIKNIRNVLDVLEQACGLEVGEGGTDARTKRVLSEFRHSKKRRKLYLIVDGIHALPPSSRELLFSLVDAPNTRFIIGAEHINAPLFISDAYPDKMWIWHDATTLIPYDIELAGYGSSSLLSTNGAQSGSSTEPLTKSAASHVLASVTHKAKRLFHILVTHQMQDKAGMSRTLLSKVAAEKLFVTAGTALTALLSEFVDHRLVVMRSDGAAGDGQAAGESGVGADGDGERVVVNLRPDVLASVESSLRAELGE